MKDRFPAARLLFWSVVAVMAAQYNKFVGVVALVMLLLDWRGTAKWEQGSDGKYRHPNEAILFQKFGRWTRLAQYGPLALLAVLALWRQRTNSLLSIKVALWGVGAFLLWGLYLCYVIAVGKGEQDDGKTL